jgi:hypothetical protein
VKPPFDSCARLSEPGGTHPLSFHWEKPKETVLYWDSFFVAGPVPTVGHRKPYRITTVLAAAIQKNAVVRIQQKLPAPAAGAAYGRTGLPGAACAFRRTAAVLFFFGKIHFSHPLQTRTFIPKGKNFIGYIVLSASLPFNRLGVNGCFCGVNSGKTDAFLVYNKNKEVSINIKSSTVRFAGKGAIMMKEQETMQKQEYEAEKQLLADDELEYAAGGRSAVNTAEIESLLDSAETADNSVKLPSRFLK